MQSRWSLIREIWTKNSWLLIIVGWALGLLTVPALEGLSGDFLVFIQDLVPEGVGILFTVLIIDRLDARRQTRQLQVRLVREAIGQSSEMGKTAIDWMQHENWLTGEKSLLRKIEAPRANLEGVDLARANISGTDFYKSKFNGANLYKVKAKNTNFAWADLRGADCIQADFTGANLEGALLDGVKFDHPNREPAIMPDSKPWTETTDLTRFTDHTHADFWRSNDKSSFAHPSKDEIWQKQRNHPEEVHPANTDT